MNELALSNDLNVITAEINSYFEIGERTVFEIGKRFKHVKENDLAYGQWQKWCEESIGITSRQASRYIKVYERFGERNLGSGLKKLDMLTAFSDEELEQPIKTSSGATKTLTEMTQREIQEYKRRAEEAEHAAKITKRKLEQAENRPPKVIEKVVQDETKIQRLEAELIRIKDDKDRIERQMQHQKNDADQYQRLKEELSVLRSKRDNLHRQIDSASEIGKFIPRVERALEEDLAPIKYSRAITEQRHSPVVMKNLDDIVRQVENWCKEIRGLMPDKNTIDMEVIDYE